MWRKPQTGLSSLDYVSCLQQRNKPSGLVLNNTHKVNTSHRDIPRRLSSTILHPSPLSTASDPRTAPDMIPVHYDVLALCERDPCW